MPLYSETFQAGGAESSATPTLVFLHGLLGNGRDWRRVIDAVSPFYSCVTVDLPGHGHSRFIQVADFAEANAQLNETLAARGIGRYVLVGYSLGARLAMYHACQSQLAMCPSDSLVADSRDGAESGDVKCHGQLAGIILEGGHFGLPESERAARWHNDQRWAKRFTQEPIEQALADWYQQPVFSSLNHDQRQSLIAKRSDNLGLAVAHMMLATSLAKQPQLLSDLMRLSVPVHYLCGEQDDKFRQLATQTALSLTVIQQAGHNAHAEQPDSVATAIRQILNQIRQVEGNDA